MEKARLRDAKSAFISACMRSSSSITHGARLTAAKDALRLIAKWNKKAARPGDFEEAVSSVASLESVVDLWITRDGQTPCFVAAMYGRDQVLKWLIEELRADVNKQTKCGWTPVFVATRFGLMDCIVLLCEAGAAVNKPTTEPVGDFPAGATALDAAVMMRHKAAARKLIEDYRAWRGLDDKGAKDSLADRADKIAAAEAEKELEEEAARAQRKDRLAALAGRTKQGHFTGKKPQTPKRAPQRPSPTEHLFSSSLGEGARRRIDIEQQEEEDEIMRELNKAASAASTDGKAFFFGESAEAMGAEAKYDLSDETFLLKAAEKQDWAAVEALAKMHAEAAQAADPDIKWTALHWATAEKAPASVVKALFDAFPGALFLKDIDGKTPSDIAADKKHAEATALFDAAKAALEAAEAEAEAEKEGEDAAGESGDDDDDDDESDEDDDDDDDEGRAEHGGVERLKGSTPRSDDDDKQSSDSSGIHGDL